MNWLDLLILFIIIYNIFKGLSLGFIKSVFYLIQFILAILLTKRYYPVLYGYIINNPHVYDIFKNILGIIIKILFFSKIEKDPTFLTDIISKGVINIIINVVSILIVYMIVRFLLGLVLNIVSGIFKVPVLRQLDKIGGFLFGIIKGMVIVYIIFALLSPITYIFPDGKINKGIDESILSEYFIHQNFIRDFFDSNDFI